MIEIYSFKFCGISLNYGYVHNSIMNMWYKWLIKRWGIQKIFWQNIPVLITKRTRWHKYMTRGIVYWFFIQITLYLPIENNDFSRFSQFQSIICIPSCGFRWSFGSISPMMTSSNRNIFRPHYTTFVRGSSPVTAELPSQWQVIELLCFLWSGPEQTVTLTIETLAIWDAIVLIMTSL